MLFFVSYSRGEVAKGPPRLFPPSLNLAAAFLRNKQIYKVCYFSRTKEYKYYHKMVLHLPNTITPNYAQRLVLTNKVEHYPPTSRNPLQEEKT